MAKKNLASLMSGIMGEPEPQTAPATPVKEQTVYDKQYISTDNKEEDNNSAIENSNPRKAGRPRKSDSEKSQEIRATFIVNNDQLRKIKYISLVEGVLLKDIVERSFAQFIEDWEKANSTINLPKTH